MTKISATFAWVEYLSSESDTDTPTNLNMGSTMAADLAPGTYQIKAGEYSYEKWIKASFSGTFTTISNIKFWKSSGAYVTGESIDFTGEQETYVVPVTTESTIATTTLPTSEPSVNVSIDGSLSGELSAAGSSDFIVLQTAISTSASSGVTNSKTFTLTYDEV